MMDEMILNVNTLPYPLHRRIHSERVRVQEENGVIMADANGNSSE